MSNQPGSSPTPAVSVEYRFAPIPEGLLYDQRVDPLAVRIYGCLLRHGMDPESCYPKHETIAGLVGCAKRSVQRPLRVLEDTGWITRVPRWDQRGDRTSDGFLVRSVPWSAQENAPPALQNADPPRSTTRTPRAEERVQGNESQLNESQLNDAPDRLPAAVSDRDRNRAALDKLPKGVDPEAVQALCKHLSKRCKDHHPAGRQHRIGPEWVKAMGTLLNTGPEGFEGRAPTVPEVHTMIDLVFDQLAKPAGNEKFCWADQIQSASNLRRHWGKMEMALARVKRSGVDLDTAADVMRRLNGGAA